LRACDTVHQSAFEVDREHIRYSYAEALSDPKDGCEHQTDDMQKAKGAVRIMCKCAGDMCNCAYVTLCNRLVLFIAALTSLSIF